MKKAGLIILLVFFINNIFSQVEKCKSTLQKDFLSKIKTYKPTDLIPYYDIDNEKWGLMHQKTKKKLTKALMKYPSTFNPDISFSYGKCDVKINKNYELKVTDLRYDDSEEFHSEEDIQVLDSINGYRGFKVNDNGNLIAYSKAYFRSNHHYWNISKPFLFEKEYYTIVRGEKQDVIINTKGEIKKGFIYKSITYTKYKYQGDSLIYIEDFNGKKAFVTLSGSRMLYGKLLTLPQYHNESFNFSIQHNGDVYMDSISKSGVLDLVTMKWLIKPKKKLKIIDIIYTSENDIKTDFSNRKKANIYFIVSNGKSKYLIDEKRNKYIPK
ncbi:hypothetical protein [uncultured Tenacibaculum sp.]|uniref:hypothetical protein n=1 Tax=uncultured Tenacibaculum sp. TaxID=174713 RepID=UPI002611B59B|nr:hypothetical protein [uncultured Tenacibaculum sp.]